MEVKEKANILIKNYTKIQGDLYHQIERVEYSITLLKEQKTNLFTKRTTKNKIEKLIAELEKYKTLLQGNAYFIDVKLSALTKESLKPEATIDSLNRINQYKYQNEINIKMPQEIVDELANFGIIFDEKDQVCIHISEINSDKENDFCM